MIHYVQNGDIIIPIDSNYQYSGEEEPDEAEKIVRKILGLPLTKRLVYYGKKDDPNSKVNIISYQVLEMYEITERWFTIQIHTNDNQDVFIHSGYLAEMQKPSFISDMAEQMR